MESYADATKSVSQEATALAVLYRDVSSYPLPVRTRLQGSLREYVKYVIRDAWPEQQEGRVPRGGVERIRRFEEILTGFEPSTEGQKILHGDTLRAHDRMIEARRLRLDTVQTALPGIMWTVIFFGAALGLIGSYFFRVGDARLHMSLVILLATFIALVIFVVLAFDRPFRGDMGISSEPYQLVIRAFDGTLRQFAAPLFMQCRKPTCNQLRIMILFASCSEDPRRPPFQTVTPTPCIVPPLNVPGVLYSLLTASPLSDPTHSPSPDRVNLPGWVFIGPSATALLIDVELGRTLRFLMWPCTRASELHPWSVLAGRQLTRRDEVATLARCRGSCRRSKACGP